jgi:hypothetical protein
MCNADISISHVIRSATQLAGLLLSISVLVGCAATAPVAGTPPTPQEITLKEVDTELAKGQRDKAVALLEQAAKESPTSAVPWLKLSNIWFEAGNYPSTILAATEVLQRDASNQEAKGMLVVAGLRVAAGAVAGLRANGSMGTNARVEAENLTNTLRNILGEKVLVPAPAEAKPANYTPRTRNRAGATTGHAPARPSSSGTDPFKSLK